MTTRHELIIGDNIIATTYIDPAREGQDIFMYDVPRWDDIPEAIRNMSDNRAGQGTKISKRRRQNGKEFQAILGARNDTMATFELRDELIALNKSQEFFDITLIRYIEVVGNEYPIIRTETFEDCVIIGDIIWVWQGEDSDNSDVEITISFRSQNAEPVVTIEDGNPDEQEINATVISDANASHTAISAYVTGIYPMPTEQELEALLVLTGQNTGDVTITGNSVQITISSPVTGFSQVRNATITIDWSTVNASVDADITATLAAIAEYLPETLEEPLTVDELLPLIVSTGDNVITLRLQAGNIFVDGANPRSGYNNTQSMPIPPVENPEIPATIDSDIAATIANLTEIVKTNRAPNQTQMDTARHITGDNVITVNRTANIITVSGSNPGSSYTNNDQLNINSVPDWNAINESVNFDISATAQNINSFISNSWDGVTPITNNTLLSYITASGDNIITATVEENIITINGSSPITGYVGGSSTIYIPTTGTLEGDLDQTLLNITDYIAQNPEYTLTDLETQISVSFGNTITLSEDENFVIIEGTDGIEVSFKYYIKQTPANLARIADIDNSLNETLNSINDYIANNPSGPFDAPTFESLKVEIGLAKITLYLNDNLLVEAQHDFSDMFFPYIVSSTVAIPKGGNETLDSDMAATAQNITDFWILNPTWDPQYVSDWSTFTVESEGNSLYLYASSANVVGISGYRAQTGYSTNANVVNPALDVDAIKLTVDNDLAAYNTAVNDWITNNPSEVLTNSVLMSLFPTPTDSNSFNGNRADAYQVIISATNADINYTNNVFINNEIPSQWVQDAKNELKTAVEATQTNINDYIANNPGWTENEIINNGELVVPPATTDYGNFVQIRPDWSNPGLPPVSQGYSNNINYQYFWSNTDNEFIEV